MTKTIVKICGVTRAEDAQRIAEAGADFVGLNFFSGPRKIDFAQAERILLAIPHGPIPVGLFALQSRGPSSDSAAFVLNRILVRQVYGFLDEIVTSAEIFSAPIERRDVWIPVRVAAPDTLSKLRDTLAKTKLKV